MIFFGVDELVYLVVVDVQQSDLGRPSRAQGGPEKVHDIEDVDLVKQVSVPQVQDIADLLVRISQRGVTGADPAVSLETLTAGTDGREVQLETLSVRRECQQFTYGLRPALGAVPDGQPVLALDQTVEARVLAATFLEALGADGGHRDRPVEPSENAGLGLEPNAAALQQEPESINDVGRGAHSVKRAVELRGLTCFGNVSAAKPACATAGAGLEVVEDLIQLIELIQLFVV